MIAMVTVGILKSIGGTSTPLAEYRKQYSSLVSQWNTSTNAVERILLKQQIEQLKQSYLNGK